MKSPPTLNRPFPTEIFLVILSFCTPKTLTKVCRTSHEFLALASPILYRNVKVTSNAQLYSLFERKSGRFKSTSKLKTWLKGSIRGGGPDLVPTSNPLPPSHLLPFLSLAQIRTLHLSIDINSPVPTTAQGTYLSFPFSRLVNTGTSSLNLQTLVVETRSGFIELDEKDSVYSYVKTKELVLILLPRPPPAKGEETCDPPMRSVTPSATRMGIEDVTIVMFPEVGGGGVYRPERLLGGLRRRGDEEGTLRFVLRLDRKRYSVQDLVGCLKYMIGQSCLPLRGWGGREGALVLDVETEEEFDAVEGWLERLKSVLNMAEEEKRCIKVVIQESRWWRE